MKKKADLPKRAIDQMGYKLKFVFPPRRIVSLVPSQSELLWELGLHKELVGITRFCIHPEEMYRSVTRVGGTKKVDLKKVEALKPDLIIGNKEENARADIEALRKKFPVWMSDIETMKDAEEMILQVGKITAKEKAARKLVNNIKQQKLKHPLKPGVKGKKIKIAYFIWHKPYMVAGVNTYLNDVFTQMGLYNVFAAKKWKKKHFENANLRYPQISARQLVHEKPDVILLSSEPFPFGAKHLEEFSALCPQAKVMVADGEFFSWYGSRMQKALPYLSSLSALIHLKNSEAW